MDQHSDAGPIDHVLLAGGDVARDRFLQRQLAAGGCQVEVAEDDLTALWIIERRKPDLVVLDLDAPGAVRLCRRLKQDRLTRLLPLVVTTRACVWDERIAALQAGADAVLPKPLDPLELIARAESSRRLKLYTEDLDSASSIVTMLGTMIEAREGCAPGHCHRLANYAVALGRVLGLPEADLQTLWRGGFLHDLGMLALPGNLSVKAGALDPDERALMRSHTTIGDGLCAQMQSLQRVRAIIRHHHERLDGSGYPDGLEGDEIPLLAQIVSIVDVYEALTAGRSYQPPRSLEYAIDTLRGYVLRGWRSGELTEAFIQLVEERRDVYGGPEAGLSPIRLACG